MKLTLLSLVTHKWVLWWQTVKTQMKCHRMKTFHLGLYCLLRQKRSSEKEIQYYLEIISFDHSIYTMDHPRKNPLLHRAYPGSEVVIANTLAKWKKLEPNEINLSQGFSQKVFINNSFPTSGDFCCLLITFANNLDPDQARQNVGPDLDPNCLTLRWY